MKRAFAENPKGLIVTLWRRMLCYFFRELREDEKRRRE